MMMENMFATTHEVACQSALNRVHQVASQSKLNRREQVAKIQPLHLQIDDMSLGCGSFSQVHRVRININNDDNDDQSCSVDTHKQDHYYALKCLNNIQSLVSQGSFQTAITDLALEADILSRLHHPNIIQLHGVMSGSITRSFEDSDVGYFLLLDLLEDTLESRLRRWRRQESMMGNVPRHQDSLRQRIEGVAVGVAKGMEYLHRNNVILRDLKPDNIGFDKYGNVKLFDFGFAREIHTCKRNEVAGSLRYMAPENLKIVEKNQRSLVDRITLSSDVYSFGVVLWEICTLQRPYQQVKSCEELVDAVVYRNWRPSVKSIPSNLLRRLITQCWSGCPITRPSFTEIRTQLELKSLPREQRRQRRSFRFINKNKGQPWFMFSQSSEVVVEEKEEKSSSIHSGSTETESYITEN